MRAWLLSVAFVSVGCAQEGAQMRRLDPQVTDSCPAAPGCAGSGGTSAGTGSEPSDFGNAGGVPVAGASGVPVAGGSGAPAVTPDDRACSPGLYLGTYECEITLFGLLPLPLTGDVSFNLSVNEMRVGAECESGDEFCSDLVIAEGGGTLFGFAGLVGFETQLEGALDCGTGEFRAAGVDGRYGNAISTNPADPGALWTVQDPPLGMFEGELMGTHSGAGTSGASERIAGRWSLREVAMGIDCNGPFNVALQP